MVAYISYSGGVWGLHDRDGAQAWHTSTDPVRDTAVVGGVLYAATGTTAPLASAVVALRLSDDSQLWRTSIPEAEVSLSADSASVLVAASKTDAAGLYALDSANGAIRWRAAGNPNGRPSAGAGVVVANLLRDPDTRRWRWADGVPRKRWRFLLAEDVLHFRRDKPDSGPMAL